MARRRGRPARVSRKSSRPRADWVYRAGGQTLGTGVVDAGAGGVIGTYEQNVLAHSTGVANAQSHILYDSRDYIASLTRGGVGGASTLASIDFISSAARAEGRKACMLAVEGIIYVEPSTWALGNLIAFGYRLGVFEQDLSGVFSLDAAYSMWVNETVFPWSRPAHWANAARNNVMERRYHYAFGDASTVPLLVVNVRWRGRKYLNANECFGIFTELEPTSVNTRNQYWLRTLVADEG